MEFDWRHFLSKIVQLIRPLKWNLSWDYNPLKSETISHKSKYFKPRKWPIMNTSTNNYFIAINYFILGVEIKIIWRLIHPRRVQSMRIVNNIGKWNQIDLLTRQESQLARNSISINGQNLWFICNEHLFNPFPAEGGGGKNKCKLKLIKDTKNVKHNYTSIVEEQTRIVAELFPSSLDNQSILARGGWLN